MPPSVMFHDGNRQLQDQFDSRRIADRLVEAGRLGRKTGAGWYRYDKDGRLQVDPTVTEIIE